MHNINLETWPRRNHFQIYNAMDFPHIEICLQIDITGFWENRSRTNYPPTISFVYIINKAANRIPELRHRIRGDGVIEHDLIHTTLAVLGDDGTFGVCRIPFNDRFEIFAVEAEKQISKAKKIPSMDDFHIDLDGGIKTDDILSITVLPWFSFTAFSITRLPQFDSVPLLAWGKVTKQECKFLLPFYCSFHHAVVDGLHIARFVQLIEEESQKLIQ